MMMIYQADNNTMADNTTMAAASTLPPPCRRFMTKKRARRKSTGTKMLSTTICVAIAAGSSLPTSASTDRILNADGEPSYGVDVSFPIHHHDAMMEAHRHDSPFGDDRRRAYDQYMSGCRKRYANNPHACEYNEIDRMDATVHQPSSMTNYTEVGYKLVRAPDHVFDMLSDYWKDNYHRRNMEDWSSGDSITYTNHWESTTYMLDVEEEKSTLLRGGGASSADTLKRDVWEGVKPVLEEWTGMELKLSDHDMVIREYTAGSMYAPHVDHMPFVTSAIINVDQYGMEDDWPLEVYGREDGLAYNITMKPGDMFLYESHTLIHGRPFPLRGESFANILIHFEPTGKLLHDGDVPVLTDGSLQHNQDTPVLTDKGTEEGTPTYILRGSARQAKLKKEHPHVVSAPAQVEQHRVVDSLHDEKADRSSTDVVASSSRRHIDDTISSSDDVDNSSRQSDDDTASPPSHPDDIVAPRRRRRRMQMMRATAASHDERPVEAAIDPSSSPDPHHDDPIRPVEDTVVIAQASHKAAINHAACSGDLETIEKYAKTHRELLFERDERGWEPIHFAAKFGRLDAVQFFIFNGANVNSRTNSGVSVMGIVYDNSDSDKLLYRFLEVRGGEL